MYLSTKNRKKKRKVTKHKLGSFFDSVGMTTLRNLKIKTSTCKRIVKELHSYEKEVERESAKTADMKEKGADPYDLKQQVVEIVISFVVVISLEIPTSFDGLELSKKHVC